MHSSPSATDPHAGSLSRLDALRKIFLWAAVLLAGAGAVAVAVVVVLGLTGQGVPAGLVAPFLWLLPLAVLALVGAVFTGVAQRRLN